MRDDKPWLSKLARTIRRGHFWVPGDRIVNDGQTYQCGPMFVEWEASDAVTKPYPIVLVHGGGFQGSEWFDTPDGRPGWAQRFVEQGYVVLVVDRPGHGRSPFHVDTMGEMGPAFSYENGRRIYFPADLAASQDMDAARLARLLDRIGPSILLTHSASGPSGWLTADRCPGQVVAIVAVEPMGPPFKDIPNIGPLQWGLAAAPLTFEPPRHSPEDVRSATLDALRIPAIEALPIPIVTAEVSAFAAASTPIHQHLLAGGAAAELLHLPDHGVYGNGHGLIYELNSDDALQPVLAWLDTTLTSEGA